MTPQALHLAPQLLTLGFDRNRFVFGEGQFIGVPTISAIKLYKHLIGDDSSPLEIHGYFFGWFSKYLDDDGEDCDWWYEGPSEDYRITLDFAEQIAKSEGRSLQEFIS